MEKDPKVFIEHILDCIDLIEKYMQGKSEDDFMESAELQDCVIRRIEIIGEAVKNLPETIKKKYPDIQWKRIAGMRDVLIHEYFGVDLDLTFKVIKKDIPILKEKMLAIRKER